MREVDTIVQGIAAKAGVSKPDVDKVLNVLGIDKALEYLAQKGQIPAHYDDLNVGIRAGIQWIQK